jgi:plastocyanin
MKKGIAAAVLTVGLVVVVAPHAGAAATVSVKASEFKYALSTKSVSKGSVTFSLKDTGHVAHDLKINGKTSKLIQPGKSTTLKVTFSKPGKYTYVCTVPGHAAAGMKGTLIVK